MFALLFCVPARTEAQDQFCDSSFENCRDLLMNLINAEPTAIDIGMWFMEDARYSSALLQRKAAGVQIRILMDTRSNVQHPVQEQVLTQLRNGGIPMRQRTASGIEHWKVMLFQGLGKVYFGSANFSDDAFVPGSPYTNYVDETIWFTDTPSFVNSIKTRFDDCWVNTSSYADYANVVRPLTRRYPTYPVDPGLNIPPGEDFIDRSVSRLNAEPGGDPASSIDVMMYRIADDNRAVNAMVNAYKRGVPIRLIVDPDMYRDPTRLDIAYRFDQLFMAGIPMKFTSHQGLNHGKLVLLGKQKMTIFGSANWTVPSANSQHENNYFATQSQFYDYFTTFFDRRWGSTRAGAPVTNPLGVAETRPFVPEPPDKPVPVAPANAASGIAITGAKLKWNGGPWGQFYDIYFGTDQNPPLYATNRFLGPSKDASVNQSFTLPTLRPGTQYYWKIVSKTAANLTRTGNVSSFTTAGSPPPPPSGTGPIVLWTADVPAGSIVGDWTRIQDANAAGGSALQNPDRGRAKVAPAVASPANYFEMKFTATPNVAYHVWVRMRAQSNSISNDSVHLQFSHAIDGVGNPVARIDTQTSMEPVLQAGPSGAPPQGWGWTDNGWGSLGANVYFAPSSTGHTLRVQQREDGAIIDEILLDPVTPITPPGPHYNDTNKLPKSDGGSTPPPPTEPPPAPDRFVVWPAAQDPAAQMAGNWQRVSDSTAAGGFSLRNADAAQGKIAPALVNPANYFEVSFDANANVAYHVWIRAKADNNSTSNDSVHLQFSDSTDAANSAFAQIGSSSSTEFVLQAGPSGPSPRGWGWTDNGWGSPGPDIYFVNGGTHKLRVQQREDGMAIDQIVLTSRADRLTPPGTTRDDATIVPATTGSTPPPATCTDPTANNQGQPLPCTYNPPPPPTTCTDPTANNQGQPLPCTYNPPPPPTTCTDPTANNQGQPLPCTFDPPPASTGTIVLYPTADRVVLPAGANWRVGADTGAASSSIWNPDAGAAKIAPALAAPVNYFEIPFSADANVAYHVWIRMRAQGNSLSNDSVHMQLSDALVNGSPFAGIGTTTSLEFVLQAGPTGPAPSKWGWTDNGWGGLGADVKFATSGPHTLRIQQREDGAIIDQIVISPETGTYFRTRPGATANDTTIVPQ